MLTVENGEGLPDADSYASVVKADAYHAAHGNSAWRQADDDAKEVALRKATAYVDSRYHYAGMPLVRRQALEWPRTGFEWPVKRVIDATCEMALRALSGSLYSDVEAEGRIKTETIGPLSTTYADPINGGQMRFALVDDLLSPLLITKGGWAVTKMVRG